MFYAYKNLCPHLQVELEFLENQFLDQDQEYIQCSTHGALFNVETGECISGPCLGESLQKIAIQVHSDGGIYLSWDVHDESTYFLDQCWTHAISR